MVEVIVMVRVSFRSISKLCNTVCKFCRLTNCA